MREMGWSTGVCVSELGGGDEMLYRGEGCWGGEAGGCLGGTGPSGAGINVISGDMSVLCGARGGRTTQARSELCLYGGRRTTTGLNSLDQSSHQMGNVNTQRSEQTFDRVCVCVREGGRVGKRQSSPPVGLTRCLTALLSETRASAITDPHRDLEDPSRGARRGGQGSPKGATRCCGRRPFIYP